MPKRIEQAVLRVEFADGTTAEVEVLGPITLQLRRELDGDEFEFGGAKQVTITAPTDYLVNLEVGRVVGYYHEIKAVLGQ
jgi:hypothetical protein